MKLDNKHTYKFYTKYSVWTNVTARKFKDKYFVSHVQNEAHPASYPVDARGFLTPPDKVTRA
jgi:hypothetical protein